MERKVQSVLSVAGILTIMLVSMSWCSTMAQDVIEGGAANDPTKAVWPKPFDRSTALDETTAPATRDAMASVASATAQLYDPNIGSIILSGNDDGSTGKIALPFSVSIGGVIYNSFWINNNGNVTFTGPLSTYTAFDFPNSYGTVIVAPFFADVDTRPAASGKVYYKATSSSAVITWYCGGYYSNHTDKLNTFQLIITKDGRFGFSYGDMQWTTGDASGGSSGSGGMPARAGIDAGNGTSALVFWAGNTTMSLTQLAHHTFWYDTLSHVKSSRLRFYIDKNRDGDYDSGEQVANESIYFRNRSTPLATKTASDGTITIPGVRHGDQLFVRRLAYSQAAVKGSRSYAGSMFDLYLDTDSVGNTGDILPYSISTADAQKLAQNQILDIVLDHPVFAWNLVVSINWKANDRYIENLMEGFRLASEYLFDVTDGQMKLGRVDIRNDVSKASILYTLDSDVQMVTGDGRAASKIGAVEKRMLKNAIWMPMQEYGDNPGTTNFASTLAHEIGHYAFALYDEYLDGRGNVDEWATYRDEHPAEGPLDYGLMDGQGDEMSSKDEYLGSYAGYAFPYLCYWPIPCDAHRVSMQVLKYELAADHNVHLPCWQYVQRRFDNRNGTLAKWNGYNGIRTKLSLPPDGTYATECHERSNGTTVCYRRRDNDKARGGPQVPNRGAEPNSPSNIPSPYSRCTFAGGTNKVASGSAEQSSTLVDVELGLNSTALQGLVFVDKSDGRRLYSGHADRNGRILIQGLDAGDVACVFENGSVRKIGGQGEAHPAHAEYSVSTADTGPHLLLSADIVRGEERRLRVVIFTDTSLSSAPVVTIRPACADGSAVSAAQTGPLSWMAEMGIGSATEGCVEVSATSSGGQTVVATLFAIDDHPVDESLCIRNPQGMLDAHLPAGLLTDECLSVFIGSGTAPIIPGDPALVFLTEPAAFRLSDSVDPGDHFTLNWRLSQDLLTGYDATSVLILRFDESSGTWGPVTSSYTAGRDVISASDVGPGIFAVAAHESPDSVAPGAITDLAVGDSASYGGVALTWTAPGDDDMTGTAVRYRVWFSEQPITEETLPACRELPMATSPLPSGDREEGCFSVPTLGTLYYFAIQAADEAGNRGPLSNVVATMSYAKDTDADGMPDWWEEAYDLDPEQPGDGALDPDNDGLTNAVEYLHRTIPTISDTDGDGFVDGLEVAAETNPLDTSDPDSVTPGQAKLLPNGTKVGIADLLVTADFGTVASAQAEDRSAGIFLEGASTPSNTTLDVIGNLALTPNGDRCLTSCSYRAGCITIPAPLAMCNAAIGGCTMGDQPGVLGGTGLNNVGLLVKTWGRVTYADPSAEFIYVDDGSNLNDGNLLGGNGSAVRGIRVVCSAGMALPPVGRHITVTGISARYDLDGVKVRTIRTRGESDIRDSSNKVYISGTITMTDGSPLQNALVSSDDGRFATRTDAGGRYQLGVAYLWSGKVVVSAEGFVFNPKNRTYSFLAADVSNQDYTALRLFSISGCVKTVSGDPIEGAEIYDDSNDFYSETDESGHYSIDVPEGWSGTFEAYKYCYAMEPVGRSYANVMDDQVGQDYAATPYPIISGCVRTADGTPVEDVDIFTDDDDWWTSTDSSGHYSLPVTPGWSGTVRTWADLWSTDPTSRSYTDVVADATDQDYLATPDVYISGYVRTATGDPVEGAEVRDDSYDIYAETDENGHYSADVPMGWTGTLTALKYHATMVPPSISYTEVTADTDDQNYTAFPYPTISGYLKTADGTPVEDVDIFSENEAQKATTDADGYYNLAIPYGWNGTVRTWSEQWSTDPYERVYESVTADLANQNFTAIPHATISGHVRTTSGDPVAGAEIHDESYDLYAETDESGYYSIEIHRGWSGTLVVSKDLYTLEPQSRDYTDVIVDFVDQDYLAVPYPTISGYVKTVDDTPVENVEICTEDGDWWATTDSNGYYSISVPSGWSGTFETWADLWSTDPLTRSYANVTADLTGQDYAAIPDVYVSGYVTTASGEPIEGAVISDETETNYGWTDQDGYYAVGVPAGWSGSLAAYTYGYSTEPRSRLYENVITDVTGQDYTAIPWPIISGHIRAIDNAPVEGVELYTDDGDWWIYSDANGYYSLSVQPGWSGIVHTWADSWVITPASRSYTSIMDGVSDQDYTATPN